jgi:MFS transporter, UMF1 family
MMVVTARRSRWGFFLYDFANSGYVLVFGTFLFPLYVRERLFADHPRADLIWGVSLSSAVLLAALLAPLIGYLADRVVRRTVLGIAVSGVACGLVGIVALSRSAAPAPWLVVGMFVATHALYVLSVALCDSFLSQLASASERAAVSSFGWGFGYLGGVVCLLLVLGVGGAELDRAWIGFAVTAAFFVPLAALALRLLPRQRGRVGLGLGQLARAVLDRRLGLTLVAFWLINEGIVTVLFFSALFARETLELGIGTIGVVFVAVQLLAFPATWSIGRAAPRLGLPTTILTTIGLWCVLLVGLSRATTLGHFAVLSLTSSLVIGSTQALMRAHYSALYPEEAAGFSFGLYTLVTKSSTLVGPASFGIVASLAGSQRVAVLTALLPLLAGGWLFARVSRQRSGSDPGGSNSASA